MLFGSFSEMSLAEILKFISTSNQSGKLVVSTETKEGYLSVEKGVITHAVFGREEGLDALWKIGKIVEGEFEFHKELLPEGNSLVKYPTEKLLQVLKSTQSQNSAIGSFRSNVYAVDPLLIPQYQKEKDIANLKASNKVLRLLLASDGQKSIQEIAKLNHTELNSTCKVFQQLHQLGFVVWLQVSTTESVETPLPSDESSEVPVRYWRGRRLSGP